MKRRIFSKTFTYNGISLDYNRIPYNNLGERAIEIPIAIYFLDKYHDKPILEVGNTLNAYQKLYTNKKYIKGRKVIDKYEDRPGVEMIDLLDMNRTTKFKTIVSISTIEHIKQGLSAHGQFGSMKRDLDYEGPLKGISKIYDLLDLGGRALITMPFGKLTDGGWYIQSSSEYLNLLSSKYNIPKEHIKKSFFLNTKRKYTLVNPLQEWKQVNESTLKDTKYNTIIGVARAIVVIELEKDEVPYRDNISNKQSNLKYYSTPLEKQMLFFLGILQKPFVPIIQWVETKFFFNNKYPNSNK